MENNKNIQELFDIEVSELEEGLDLFEVNVEFSYSEPRPSTTSICRTRP